MGRIKFKYLWLLVIAGLVSLGFVDETWFMPGPVSRAHAPIEGHCSLCHPGFSGAPNQACLACKPKMNIDQDRGIHRYAPIKRCAVCHMEHRTRDYPLASAWVDPDTFNHQWTGFDLGQYHNKLTCRRCHAPGQPYRDANKNCAVCHDNFAPGIWDHQKTDCRLDPLHSGLACASCHIDQWGPGKKPECRSCHVEDSYKARDICQ